MKKFIALVLVLAMVLSLCTVAFAAPPKSFLSQSAGKMNQSLITEVLTNSGIDYSVLYKSELIKTYLTLYNTFVASIAESVGLQVYNWGVNAKPEITSDKVAEQAIISAASAVAYTVYYVLSFNVPKK